MLQEKFTIPTNGRGSYDITGIIQKLASKSSVKIGLCHIFIHHTSASLMLCENADPAVRSDMEKFMGRLVPDGDPLFDHIDEGPDDMPAHVRSVLTQSNLTIPVVNAHCDLGTWQGVYLWEHRTLGHQRSVTVTIEGS